MKICADRCAQVGEVCGQLKSVQACMLGDCVLLGLSGSLQPSFRPSRERGEIGSGSGKGSPVKRLVPIGSLRALFRPTPPSSTISSPVAACAANDRSPAATPPATGRYSSLIQHPRITGAAADTSNRTNSNSCIISNGCNNSNGVNKSRPATVSLFGHQAGRISPSAPSVTRFRASSGGSLLTTTGT